MDKNLVAIVCFVGILSLPCPTFYRQNEKEKEKKNRLLIVETCLIFLFSFVQHPKVILGVTFISKVRFTQEFLNYDVLSPSVFVPPFQKHLFTSQTCRPLLFFLSSRVFNFMTAPE